MCVIICGKCTEKFGFGVGDKNFVEFMKGFENSFDFYSAANSTER